MPQCRLGVPHSQRTMRGHSLLYALHIASRGALCNAPWSLLPVMFRARMDLQGEEEEEEEEEEKCLDLKPRDFILSLQSLILLVRAIKKR